MPKKIKNNPIVIFSSSEPIPIIIKPKINTKQNKAIILIKGYLIHFEIFLLVLNSMVPSKASSIVFRIINP